MSKDQTFFSSLLGKPVSRVWRGHRACIFLEFGKLTVRDSLGGQRNRPSGELTLMVEWSWRIERPKSILGGSWSSERRWPKMFEALLGASVTDVQLFGLLPEICVSLSNGLRVSSFMTDEGQPQWAVLSRKPRLGSLCVRRGVLHVDPPDQVTVN